MPPDEIGSPGGFVTVGPDRQNFQCSTNLLGGVDFKGSLLGANRIQSCFLGGSLGCGGPVGFERRGVGADGAADHRST